MWLALSALLLEIGLKSTKNMEGPVPPSPGSDSPGTSSSSTSSIRLLLYGQAIQVLEKSVSCLESVNIQKLLNISRQSLCGKKEIFLIFHMGYKATKAHFWLKLQGKAWKLKFFIIWNAWSFHRTKCSLVLQKSISKLRKVWKSASFVSILECYLVTPSGYKAFPYFPTFC